MSLFGHRSEPARERTAEERERERLERERRRASRGDGPAPGAQPPPAPSSVIGEDGDDGALPAHAEAATTGGAEPRTSVQRWTARPIARTREDALEHATSRSFTGPGGEDGHRRRLPALPHLRRPRTASGPPRTGRRRRRVAGVLALAIVGAGAWFLVSLFQPFHGGGSGRVAVNIPRGASARSIGDTLARRHVVSSGFFFSLRAALDGKRGSFHAGEFVLKHGMSYAAAIAALTSKQGPATTRVLIPEGFTRVQIATLARQDGLTGDYLHAATHNGNLDPLKYGAPRHSHSLEGFLFPATYDLMPGTPVKHLVSLQLEAFKRDFATVDLRYARSKQLTPYDVLIVASMVEREAASASEAPLVAAVIYNRLHQRMPLGIDATIRYAFNDYSQPLTAAQLASPSPYNTRVHRGLPPTPIGNPGLVSIAAAAHPAHVPYLYYVVKPGTCRQVFETSYAQFLRDSAAYQAARARAGGRSPTTCH